MWAKTAQGCFWVLKSGERQIVFSNRLRSSHISPKNKNTPVVGGWKLRLPTQDVAVVDEECSEGLAWLTVAEGLGLVPFSVDVHASQWGNLARMIHATEQQQVDVGWAIDEDTLLHVEGQRLHVWGLGQVYRVQRVGERQMHLDILRAGDEHCLDEALS